MPVEDEGVFIFRTGLWDENVGQDLVFFDFLVGFRQISTSAYVAIELIVLG